MQSRIQNPAGLLPDAMQAMLALSSAVSKSGLSQTILGLVHLRVSQVNGCSVCVDMGWRQPQGRQRDGRARFRRGCLARRPLFPAPAERAALALAEAVTRIADRPDPVPDEVWNEAARHFSERDMAALTVSIAVTNVWNRLNVATRQVAGEWLKSTAAKEWMDKHAVAQ